MIESIYSKDTLICYPPFAIDLTYKIHGILKENLNIKLITMIERSLLSRTEDSAYHIGTVILMGGNPYSERI